jgi:hypothetical protein
VTVMNLYLNGPCSYLHYQLVVTSVHVANGLVCRQNGDPLVVTPKKRVNPDVGDLRLNAEKLQL